MLKLLFLFFVGISQAAITEGPSWDQDSVTQSFVKKTSSPCAGKLRAPQDDSVTTHLLQKAPQQGFWNTRRRACLCCWGAFTANLLVAFGIGFITSWGIYRDQPCFIL